MATVERRWIGKDIPRLEDPKLLAGRATYTDDVKVAGLLHAAVLRSPHPHARIVRIDSSRARALPGVFAVVTGEDAKEMTNPLPAFCAEPVAQYALAVDKVRFVGEAVAAVAAVDRYTAEDAVALLDVEYELLPVVADPFEAIKPGAAKLHDTIPSNLVFEKTLSFGDVAGDFASADRVIRRTLRWHRVSAQPLETAGAVLPLRPDHPADGRVVEHQHDQLRGLAHRQHPQGAGEQAQHLSHVRRRQLRLQARARQGHRHRRDAREEIRPPRQVHGGPRRQPARLREPRLRPLLRRRARRHHGRHHEEHPDPRGRRLRCVLPVRPRHPRQRAGPGHRPVSDGQLRVRRAVRADQQVPAGRVPRRRLRRRQLLPRAARRRRRAGARDRPRGDPPEELHPAGPLPVQDAVREHLRQRQLRRRPRPGARRWPATPHSGGCRPRRAKRAATSASGSPPPNSAACTGRRSSGSGTRAPG